MLVVYAAFLLGAIYSCSGLVVRALNSVQRVFDLIPSGIKIFTFHFISRIHCCYLFMHQ